MELPADYMKMNASDYKSYHESFMQNNNGSSAFHTFLFINLTIMTTAICAILQRKLSLIQELILIVLPMVFAYTVLAEYILVINCLVFAVLYFILYLNRYKACLTANFRRKNTFLTNRVVSISILRGLTYLITIFAILAVDFRIFPRYLAKTERFGYSLMDTGVGLFVLMSGMVHKEYLDKKFKSFINNNLKLIFMLSILGVSRFVSVKQLDYQEHVTEYGVHWNFFFTLASVKVLTSIISAIFHQRISYLKLSIIVTVIHELLLIGGCQNWVFSDVPRNTFLSANREGITSCLGYVALYLFTAHFKKELINHTVIRLAVAQTLVRTAVLWWILAAVTSFFLPASRTLANASYCLYLEAVLLTFLAILYLLEITYLTRRESLFVEPYIIRLMNENGLLLFLCSNLLTGAINMTVRTLFVEDHVALFILNMYMLSVICIAVFLHSKNIKL